LDTRTASRRTPFHALHEAAGAKLIEFAGFSMPVRYSGDVREHLAVRQRAGLFDVSHMGEFVVSGSGALDFLNRMITNDLETIAPGQAIYSPMCLPSGGIVDDLLIYREADWFMVVVNAANLQKDFDWLRQHCPSGVSLADVSDETALLAIQGPATPGILSGNVPEAALEVGSYRFVRGSLFGVDALIARTGYTGEDGFELYFHPRHAETVWNGLLRAGQSAGLEPVGLGARDTLRLEMAYMLYGNDIDETTAPLEAGIGWTVKLAKPDFIGREALVELKQQGLQRRLVGFELDGRRVARHGMSVESGGRTVGVVSSGTFSPSLERPIGLAYVETALAKVGNPLEILAGPSRLPARVVKTPFWTQGSRKT
jgi:aminomethyltransferase